MGGPSCLEPAVSLVTGPAWLQLVHQGYRYRQLLTPVQPEPAVPPEHGRMNYKDTKPYVGFSFS